MDLLSLWEKMLANLKQVLPKEIFTNWFEGNIIPYSYSEEENLLILDTMTNFLRDYVSKKYTDVLETIAEEVIGHKTRVQLITSQEKTPTHDKTEAVAETITLPPKPGTTSHVGKPAQAVPTEWVQPELPMNDTMPAIKDAAPLSLTTESSPYNNNLNKDYTFDNFIVGNSNRVATAVAKSIAAAPAQKWNPFYIYGDSGLGKTHLMHAIGHELLKNFPNMRLLCITSEDFVNEFIQCIQDQNTESFRRRYRNVDVLFVDDIQFLGRGEKESSKEEFFHIRVLLEALQTKSNVTLPLVKHAISYITDAQDEKKYITIDEITTYICQHYNINYKELMGKKKTKDIALPRQIAMYMCRELTGNTYPHIGTAFNGRDHTTVMHACTKIMERAKEDRHFKEHIEKMMNEIRGVDN